MAPVPALVARFARRSDAEPILRAALDGDIVYVRLATPPPPGRQTLEIWVGDVRLVAIYADAVGSPRAGEYPLRLRPVHPEQISDLERMIERTALMPSVVQPRSIRPNVPRAPPPPPTSEGEIEVTIPTGRPPAGIVEDEERTLASRAPLVEPPIPSHTPPSVRVTTIDAPPRSAPPSRASIDAPRGPASDRPPPVSDRARSSVPPRPSRRKREEEESMTLVRAAVSGPHPALDMIVGDDSATLPLDVPAKSESSWDVRVPSPTEKDPLCGRMLAEGKYVLDSVIGTGATGMVFKASHRDLGRTVAIKVLNPRWRDDPELLQILRTEARAASQLEHPNVARVYDFGQEPDGLVYIVMEYLSGYTLGSVLSARHRLAQARAVDVMLQVCGALAAAHDRGIVHRDVKPDNVVLVPAQDDEGRPVENVKVCDFGIAALGTAKAGEGRIAGTPEYMAPEQQTGGPVSPAADVYACGIVLYEMLTGVVPFSDTQAYRIFLKHSHEPPCPPSEIAPEVSPALEAVVLRALEKSPARRFQSAREMRIELRRIFEPKT